MDNHDILQGLEEELEVTEKLLKSKEEVINMIPPCPAHGVGCLPHAEEWIKKRL